MKTRIKTMVGIIIISALMCILGIYTQNRNPVIEDIETNLSMDAMGRALLIQNRNGYSDIFVVDSLGNVVSSYGEKSYNKGEITKISAAVMENDEIFFIRSNDSGWELARADLSGYKAETIFKQVADSLAKVTSMVITEEGIILSGIKEEKGKPLVASYEIDLKKETVAEKCIIEAEVDLGDSFVSATYGGAKLYGILKSGKVLVADQLGIFNYIDEWESQVSAIASCENLVWHYNRKTNEIGCLGDLISLKPIKLDSNVVIKSGAVNEKGNMVFLEVKDDTKVLEFYDYNGNVINSYSQIHFPFVTMLKSNNNRVLPAFATIFAVLFIAYLVIDISRKSRRMAVKIATACICGFITMLTFTTVAVYKNVKKSMQMERIWETQLLADYRSGGVEAQIKNNISNKVNGYEEAVLSVEGLRTVKFKNNDRGFTLSSQLVEVSKEASLFVSEDMQLGLPSSIVYDTQLKKAIETAIDTKQGVAKIIKENGQEEAVDIRLINIYGEDVAVLVTRATASDLQISLNQLLKTIVAIGTGIGFVVVALIYFLCNRITKPLKHMIKEMESISDGDFEINDINAGNNEVGDMWRSMKEVEISLAIKDYEIQSIISSCKRFIPKGMNKLLGRSSIMETGLGDMVTASGSVGILSVTNFRKVRNKLDDGKFMSFVNGSFRHINKKMTDCDGIQLTEDFNLSALKMIFPNDAQNGVEFGLNVFGNIVEDTENLGVKPEMFLMLHDTSFLYGVAGTQDTAFPFLSSSEIEFLGSFAEKFSTTGSKIVATGQFLDKLSNKPSIRYIGFISSEDDEYAYKLYEVLDVYSDLEKKQRLQYEDKFQEAIKLFYKNDFYLARNMFSSILRICPNDGIARWYLFACEHYFNSKNTADIIYNLFGIKE